MSQGEKGAKGKSLIPMPQSSDRPLATDDEKDLVLQKEGDEKQGWFSSFLHDSFYGIDRDKRKVNAHRELFAAMRAAQEQYALLCEVPDRMKQEKKLREAEYAVKEDELKTRKLQMGRDQNRLLREMQEELDAKELLDKQKELRNLQLELQIAEYKHKLAVLKESARNPHEPPADPNIKEARDAIRRYMERNRGLGADKKKWFAQIDADLARGELSEEMAENMKEDIEQIIRDSLLKP